VKLSRVHWLRPQIVVEVKRSTIIGRWRRLLADLDQPRVPLHV
jgi:hypothetical protein